MDRQEGVDHNERLRAARWRSGMMSGCVALAISVAGCGSKATTVPAPTAAQAIGDFQKIAEEAFQQMESRPDNAATQLDILRETLEVRVREYGGPFSSFRDLVTEVRDSWADRPSAKSVKDGVTRLRGAAELLAGKEAGHPRRQAH